MNSPATSKETINDWRLGRARSRNLLDPTPPVINPRITETNELNRFSSLVSVILGFITGGVGSSKFLDLALPNLQSLIVSLLVAGLFIMFHRAVQDVVLKITDSIVANPLQARVSALRCY